MAHLLSFTDAMPQLEVANLAAPPNPPERPLPPTKSINASPKSALLVEHDESLLNILRALLKEAGYATRIAANSAEGLRLYRDCAPFNVVLIDYYVPPKHGVKVDCLAPLQTHGTALAMSIREINPSQRMIITALDYRNAQDVIRPPELMDIPVLIDISNFQLRSLLEKIEVDRAIEALTPSELLRLQQFAGYRVQGLGQAALGRTGEDLLSEALLRTLIGAEDTQNGRHWNKEVDFAWHLKGAMRSISTSWRRQFTEKEACVMLELPVLNAELQNHSLLENLASREPAADQRLIEKDEEERMFTIFKDDPEATEVLQGLLDGLKKNEIKPRYSLGERQYAAAVKRIRVKLLGRRNGGSKGVRNGR
jgi:CheY-like chemotaxis protein